MLLLCVCFASFELSYSKTPLLSQLTFRETEARHLLQAIPSGHVTEKHSLNIVSPEATEFGTRERLFTLQNKLQYENEIFPSLKLGCPQGLC